MASDAAEHVRYEVDGDGVACLTLDRPDAKHALTVEMRDRLIDAVRATRQDPAARCLLLTGTGTAFCAGMDLGRSTIAQAGTDDFDPRTTSEALRVGVQTLIRELWELDKPTVAAVNGAAVGPGAHLALACDFVLVHPRTRFLWPFTSYGLVIDAGGAYLLPRLVGMARAKEIVLLGEGSTGEQAVADGLAYRCVDQEELAEQARELAVRLAAGPTRAMGLSKQLLNRAFESDVATSLELEGHFQSLATTSQDLLEGMAAVRERRTPRFRGR